MKSTAKNQTAQCDLRHISVDEIDTLVSVAGSLNGFHDLLTLSHQYDDFARLLDPHITALMGIAERLGSGSKGGAQ